MRPVDRKEPPKQYSNYQDAIGDLEERLGIYCSYCESRMPAGLAVEHKAPKSKHPDLKEEWSNFLLGCGICNPIKSDKEDDVLWPDQDNTVLALSYFVGGFIKTADNLSPDVNKRAQALIDLVGLNRHGAGESHKLTRRDKRWSEREKVWALAETCRSYLEALGKSNEALELVCSVAEGHGFFSVWFSVFQECPEVRKALIEKFPGTASSCFGKNGNPVRRPGGAI